MLDRKKIIEIALHEIGYKEFPDNSNNTKYGKWFGLDGKAWCVCLLAGSTAWQSHHCQK